MKHHLNNMRHTILGTPPDEDFARPVEGALAADEEARKEKMKKRKDQDIDALD